MDDAGVHRYPSRPVKSVSEHFLYADNSVTPSPETEPDEIPLRQPPRRHKPTQQCVMFRVCHLFLMNVGKLSNIIARNVCVLHEPSWFCDFKSAERKLLTKTIILYR